MHPDGIAALVEPQIPGLRRYALALLRDEEGADDLVQDTLERALSRWPQRRPEGDLRAWLFTLLRNLHLDAARRRQRRGVHLDEGALADAPAPGGAPDSGLAIRDVLTALDALPEEQRSVLILVAVEDLSYADVASVIGVPVGTVMSRLSRARERVRCFVETGRTTRLRSVK